VKHARWVTTLVGSLMLFCAAAFAADAPVNGPAGDVQITDQVVGAIRAVDPSAARRLQVTTKDGIVTLSGQAYTSYDVAMALSAAKSVPGVSKVLNRTTFVQ
jgi:osmotically-inducible protein OsmY